MHGQAATGLATSTIRKQGEVDAGALLTVSSMTRLSPQPMGRCCPQSGWALPRSSLSRRRVLRLEGNRSSTDSIPTRSQCGCKLTVQVGALSFPKDSHHSSFFLFLSLFLLVLFPSPHQRALNQGFYLVKEHHQGFEHLIFFFRNP